MVQLICISRHGSYAMLFDHAYAAILQYGRHDALSFFCASGVRLVSNMHVHQRLQYAANVCRGMCRRPLQLCETAGMESTFAWDVVVFHTVSDSAQPWQAAKEGLL
jgi:hypothetical protein